MSLTGRKKDDTRVLCLVFNLTQVIFRSANLLRVLFARSLADLHLGLP